MDGGVPRHYVPQCHKYPLVLNDDRIVATFIGCIYGNTPNEFYCSRVERDLDYEKEQLEREVAYWQNYVEKGIEPARSSDPDKALTVLRAKNGPPTDAESVIVFDEAAFGDIMRTYVLLQDQKKALSKKIDTVETQMKNLMVEIVSVMGTAQKGTMPCPADLAPGTGDYEYVVSNKPRKGTTVDKEKMLLDFPDAYHACVSTNPNSSQTFSLKIARKKMA